MTSEVLRPVAAGTREEPDYHASFNKDKLSSLKSMFESKSVGSFAVKKSYNYSQELRNQKSANEIDTKLESENQPIIRKPDTIISIAGEREIADYKPTFSLKKCKTLFEKEKPSEYIPKNKFASDRTIKLSNPSHITSSRPGFTKSFTNDNILRSSDSNKISLPKKTSSKEWPQEKVEEIKDEIEDQNKKVPEEVQTPTTNEPNEETNQPEPTIESEIQNEEPEIIHCFTEQPTEPEEIFTITSPTEEEQEITEAEKPESIHEINTDSCTEVAAEIEVESQKSMSPMPLEQEEEQNEIDAEDEILENERELEIEIQSPIPELQPDTLENAQNNIEDEGFELIDVPPSEPRSVSVAESAQSEQLVVEAIESAKEEIEDVTESLASTPVVELEASEMAASEVALEVVDTEVEEVMNQESRSDDDMNDDMNNDMNEHYDSNDSTGIPTRSDCSITTSQPDQVEIADSEMADKLSIYTYQETLNPEVVEVADSEIQSIIGQQNNLEDNTSLMVEDVALMGSDSNFSSGEREMDDDIEKGQMVMNEESESHVAVYASESGADSVAKLGDLNCDFISTVESTPSKTLIPQDETVV